MKLSHSIFVFCSFLLKFLLADNNQDCKFWNQLASKLSHAEEQNGGAVRLACNSSCTSISCSGHFKAPTMVLSTYEFDFCFGLRLNHCENPVTMDYYLEAPDTNVNLSGAISHNATVDIPGPQIMGGESTIVIVVEMIRVNSSHILFGVNGNLRLTIGGFQTFPVAEKILPPTYIDVPPCTQKQTTKTPFTAPAVCTAPPALTTTKATSAPKINSTTSAPKINSKTYKRSCEIGIPTQCGQYEMCKAINDKSGMRRSGICVCQPGSSLHASTGLCSPFDLTTLLPSSTAKPKINTTPSTPKSKINSTPANTSGHPSVTAAQKTAGKAKHGGINMTAVIIGAVFGGLLLIVVVVSVIIFIGRRRRQADYRGQHQLLSDHDDENDTNMVI